MENSEIQPPHDGEADFNKDQFEEVGPPPLNSVIETAITKPPESTDNVYNFESREKVPAEQIPENQSVQLEQLRNAIELLRADIQQLDAQIAKREQLIVGHKEYFDKTRLFEQQKQLNRDLIEDERQINALTRKLNEIASDKTFFFGKIRHKDLYDQALADLELIKARKAQHREMRSNESGNYYDLQEILASRKELFEGMKEKLDFNIAANSVYFINLPSRLSEENRADQKLIIEKKKEIEQLEAQLAFSETFKK